MKGRTDLIENETFKWLQADVQNGDAISLHSPLLRGDLARVYVCMYVYVWRGALSE